MLVIDSISISGFLGCPSAQLQLEFVALVNFYPSVSRVKDDVGILKTVKCRLRFVPLKFLGKL